MMFNNVKELDPLAFPRPDFMREDWISLNGQWDFSFDDDRFDKTILVPYAYQAPASGIGTEERHNVVWYRKVISVPAAKLEDKRVLLHFGAVDYLAMIYINGNFAGSHEGGHTSFSLNVTSYLKEGENEIRVRVEDGNETDKPRGKQTWKDKNFGCWYTPTTGIWQSVWLEYVGDVYIKRIKITPDLDNNSALYEIFLPENSSAEVSLKNAVRSEKDGCVYPLDGASVTCVNGYGKALLAFPDLDLCRDEMTWSIEHPNLIFVEAELSYLNKVTDRVMTYFGMRSVQFHENAFYINGEVRFQRLVLDQAYWPETLMTLPEDEMLLDEIRLIKAMGFNGVRMHQKIEDPRFYYLADREGLLVWGELPSCYMFNDRMIRRSINEMIEFIERDFNHPSIVVWVPINESWGIRNVVGDKNQQSYEKLMINLIKAYDQTRPVSGNDGWEQTSDTDIIALHDYSLMAESIYRYDDMDKLLAGAAESRMAMIPGEKTDKKPVMLTEYGGIAFAKDEDGWGYYEKVKTTEEYLEKLRCVTHFLIKSGKFAGFCYTQLTDVQQEQNGLLTKDRIPKADPDALKAIFGAHYYDDI